MEKLTSMKEAALYCKKKNLVLYKRVGDKGFFENLATGDKHTLPLNYNWIGEPI